MATAQPTRDEVRDTISWLVHRGLGVEDYWRAVTSALEGVVPSDGSCLMTMDPATMLPTAEFVENGMPADAFSRLVEIELNEPDYNKWVNLARAGKAVASLSDVTAGELDRSRRHRDVRRPDGYSDELRVVLSSHGDLGRTHGLPRDRPTVLLVVRGAARRIADRLDLGRATPVAVVGRCPCRPT